MSLVVRCKNIVRYDPQAGKYVHCNHEFPVKQEQAGQTVRCPKCGQSVTATEAKPDTSVAAPKANLPAAPKEPSAAPKEKSSQVKGPEAPKKKPPAAPALPTLQPETDDLLPDEPLESKREAAPVKTFTPPPIGVSDPDYPEVVEDDEEEGFRLLAPVELPKREAAKPQSALPDKPLTPPPGPRPPSPPGTPVPPPILGAEPPIDDQAPCAGCGRQLLKKSVICPHCGYHKGLQRRVDAFEDGSDSTKPAGFERWMRRQLSEGDDPQAMRSVLIVGGLVLLGLGAMLFMIIGHAVWLFVLGPAIAAAGAWMGWWKLDPWQWLLFVNRMLQWRTPLPPFKPRKVLDLRNMPLNDEELGNLKNLNEFEVLDLEGTPITDLGLTVLHDYRNLKFIILRDTQVTEEGVHSLQRALLGAWIWR